VSWLARAAGIEPSFARVFGLRPDLLEGFERLYGLIWDKRLVDPVLLELCRLRVAEILGCDAERKARSPAAVESGLDEGAIAELATWRTSARFSDLERACLAFCEGFVKDVHGLTDEDVATITRLLGEPGTVALAEAVGLFEGFCRFRIALGIQAPADRPAKGRHEQESTS
jgi:alkylhydroperoxidase family enzyme